MMSKKIFIIILILIIVVSLLLSSRKEKFSNGDCKNMLLMNPYWAYWLNLMDFWGKSMTGNFDYYSKSSQNFKTAGASLGGKCRVTTDCANWMDKKAVCCTSSGYDNPITEVGVCTKPCINGGIAWCPKTAQDKSFNCY